MVVGYGGDVEGGMMISSELHQDMKEELQNYFSRIEEHFPSTKTDMVMQLEIFAEGGKEPEANITEALETIVVGLDRERAKQIVNWLKKEYRFKKGK